MANYFLEHLKKHHKGQENAVLSRELERVFGLKNREIRLVVNSLRNAGHPICSSGNGYYYARDQTEVKRVIGNLSSRISSISKAKKGLLKSLDKFPDTSGQISFIERR